MVTLTLTPNPNPLGFSLAKSSETTAFKCKIPAPIRTMFGTIGRRDIVRYSVVYVYTSSAKRVRLES